MNKRITKLARQAGFNDFPNDENGVWITDGYRNEELERFAELVAAAEREACAKVCEEKALYFQYDFIAPYDVADSCAEEIRRREK